MGAVAWVVPKPCTKWSFKDSAHLRLQWRILVMKILTSNITLLSTNYVFNPTVCLMKPAFLPVVCYNLVANLHGTWPGSLFPVVEIHRMRGLNSDSIYWPASPSVQVRRFRVILLAHRRREPVLISKWRHCKASLDHNVTPLTSCKCLRAPTSLLCAGVLVEFVTSSVAPLQTKPLHNSCR